MVNPFTDEKIIAHLGDLAIPEQVTAGDAVLDSANATASDPDGFRKVQLLDGRYMCVEFGPRGGVIHIEGGLYPDAIALVFRLASASAMLVTSTIDPGTTAVLPGQRHSGIDERWPTAIDIDSADSLLHWVESKILKGRIA